MIKQVLHNLSYIGVKKTDTESEINKKTALTLIPFYVAFPALVLSFLYYHYGRFEAFIIPVSYITISMLSSIYLYKTKKFMHFEILQLTMILLLPFILMWFLGGFYTGGFVFIWAFYAPVAATMYSENVKINLRWFSAFIILLLISSLIDAKLIENNQQSCPDFILNAFLFINIAAGLSGIYFLIRNFIHNINTISLELKRDRESLYNLTKSLQETNEELEYLANSDIVTNLPNRLSFVDIVKKMFSQAKKHDKQIAILFLDLDGFKAVNDTLGHEAGDMILKVVGSRLESVVRTSDIVARIGGDEFAIALGEITEQKHVEQIAKTIIQEINHSYTYQDQECEVGVSIGISLYPQHAEDIEELLKKADSAMYDIKKTGKNHFAIYTDQEDKS